MNKCRTGVLLSLGAWLLAGSVVAQEDEPFSFQVDPSFDVDKAIAHMESLGFHCAEESDEDAAVPEEFGYNCGLGQAPGQFYAARLVGDVEGNLLSLTVHANRDRQGLLEIPPVIDLFKKIAKLEYVGADPDEVGRWLEDHIELPMTTPGHPEAGINERTGLPDLAPTLQLGNVTCTIVGMPNSPGFEMALTGY